MENLDKVTTKELIALHHKTDGEIQVLKEKKRALKKVMNERGLADKIESMAGNLSDKERARLLTTLSPKGIGTKTEFGTPGK